jgi:hypothetical protein
MTSLWYPSHHELEAPSADPVLAAALARGEREPNRLADLVFYARHSERRGRRIGPGERQLAQEWIAIRDRIVMPALHGLVTAPAPVAPPSPFTLPPDPSQHRPPPRTHVSVTPLFPGDKAIDAQLRLIRDVASRPDGFVYLVNWYAGLSVYPPVLLPVLVALKQCAQRGGTIRAIFWDGSMHKLNPYIRSLSGFAGALFPLVERQIRSYIVGKTNHDTNAATAKLINDWCSPRGFAILDDETLPVGSHHQKFFVAGNNEQIVGIVGGVDLNKNRIVAVKGESGTPYFDISIQVDGHAAADLADLFVKRWRAAANPYVRQFIQLPQHRRPAVSPTSGGATVQIGPNFGCGAPFADTHGAVRGGSALIANLLRNCSRYFYAEDQYGVGNEPLGRAIQSAFDRGARYGVVVLANVDAGSDLPDIRYHRWRFWTRFRRQLEAQQLFVFERLGDDFDRSVGPHAYVHSKLVIVDDAAASVGSINMNRRSWFYDSELTAIVSDAPELIRGLRLGIWRAHLKPSAAADVSDAEIGGWEAARGVWSGVYSGTRAAPRLKPLRFERQPSRESDTFGINGFLYDNIYDPEGPQSC